MPRTKEELMKNLNPYKKGDPYAKEMSKKANETRWSRERERKKIKEDLDTLLKISLKRGDIVSGDDILNLDEAQHMNVPVQTAINIAMIKRALLGDVQAALYIRDTIGEKPSDKVELDQSLTIESWAKNHDVKL